MNDPEREELEQRFATMSTEELQALFAAAGDPAAPPEPDAPSEPDASPVQPEAVTNKGGGKVK